MEVSSVGVDTNLMRVARLYGIRDLRIEHLPRPTPAHGEVLLKVASVGVCGSDVHYYVEGSIGDQIVAEPMIPGHEFSAWVAEPAPGVNGLVRGAIGGCRAGRFRVASANRACMAIRICAPVFDSMDRQTWMAPARNTSLCRPRIVFRLPDGFTPDQGVLLETLGIAIHSVDLAHQQPGHTVAVLGAGPIGLLTAAVARAAGASQIFMTEPLDHRREFALDYTADAVFNPNECDVVEEIMRQTDGRGTDIVFEAAGAPETPAQATEIVRPGGKVIVSGIPSDDTMTMKAGTIRRKGLTIKLVRRMKHTYPRAIRMVQTGLVDVRSVDHTRLPDGSHHRGV